MLSKIADVLESSFRRFLSHYQFLSFWAITFYAAKVRRLNWALVTSKMLITLRSNQIFDPVVVKQCTQATCSGL